MRGALVTTCSGLLLAAAPGVYVIEGLRRDDRTALSPGPGTAGHSQIETACDQCHPSGGGDVQAACIRCHATDLRNAEDSHPVSLFDDPARAEMLEWVDATRCASCHLEHRPHLEDRGWHAQSVTAQVTMCADCHADVFTARASHKGFDRAGCSAIGCHHYHDNRALYETKLRAHLDDPALLPSARVVGETFGPPESSAATGAALAAKMERLTAAPDDGTPLEPATTQWRASRHAQAEVGCVDCHQPPAAQSWRWRPGVETCTRCHGEEQATFAGGKHGMRRAAGLSTLTTEQARLPMKNVVGNASPPEVNCSSCHTTHRYDVQAAAVDACERCHDDRHTRAYRDSIHFVLWRKEMSGEAAAGTGVSCATCHMPRMARPDAPRRHRVDHNQNRNLRPRDKMAESICGSCHGLPFTLAALADEGQIGRNFAGAPASTVFTGIDLMRNAAALRRGFKQGGSR